MNKLLYILVPAVLVSGGLGFTAGRMTQDNSIAAAQLEIMQKQQAEADAAKAKQRKMIDDFKKSVQN